jgi:hypothetical protein
MATEQKRVAPAAEPIRADLGRPETPEETAARKAQNSRNYRAAKTPNNLVIALVASLAIVLFLVIVVVRPTPAPADAVDYVAVAAEAQPGVTSTLATPVLPPGWNANAASLKASRGDSFLWYIGFVTPETQFLALEQGIYPESDWREDFLGEVMPAGETTIDGVTWEIYDQRDSDDPGNFAYSLATTVADSEYLIHGTASDAEFALFAAALAAEITPQED